jgi:hypothetical protein
MRPAPALASLLASVLLPSIAAAEPLPTTNQNPFLAAVGLPAPLPSTINAGSTQLTATLNWASTAIVDSDADEILIVDAESRELRMAFTHSFSERLALRVELPYLYTGPGVLDGFIDDFHDAFGFSEGDRPLFRRDQLTLWYLRSGQPSYVNRTTSTDGLGDLTISLGSSLVQTERSALTAWLTIGAPTASSGAYVADTNDWKFSATLAAQHRFAQRLSTFAQASATGHTGDGVFDVQKRVIWSGHVGLDFAVTRRVTLTTQAQAHSSPFSGSDLQFLQDAIVLTVGGTIQATDSLAVHLALSEDVKVEASPDAVLVLGMGMKW